YRLAGARFRLGPVGAAELVQRRLFPADVPGELVELVGGDEQPVAGLAAFARRVLDDDVLALGAVDGPLYEFDVSTYSVLFVYHEAGGLELQRIDGVASPARHLAHVPGGGAAPAGDVGTGDRGEAGRLVHEPELQAPGGHHRRPDRWCRVQTVHKGHSE